MKPTDRQYPNLIKGRSFKGNTVDKPTKEQIKELWGKYRRWIIPILLGGIIPLTIAILLTVGVVA